MVPPQSDPLFQSQTRRIAKRVEWSPESSLTVDVLRLGRAPLPACWADLSVSGVMLIVPSEESRSFKPNSDIKLEVTVDEVRFHLMGKVVWGLPDDTGKIIKAGVRFEKIDENLGSMHPELWTYFNRREAYRAGSEEDKAIDVQVESSDGNCMGRLVDLSSSGVSLIFDAGAATSTALDPGLGHKYSLSMKLAADLPDVTLIARAEREEQDGIYKTLAFSFAQEDESESREERAVIADFVQARTNAADE